MVGRSFRDDASSLDALQCALLQRSDLSQANNVGRDGKDERKDMTMSTPTMLTMDPDLADQIAPHRTAYVAEGIWTDERLGNCVSAHAAENPDAEAVVDRKGLRRISFADFDRLSNRFAHWLDDAGIVEGDVIAVQLPNCLEAVVIAIGANKAGVAVAPMLTIYRGNELRHNLDLTAAKAIFVPDVYRGFAHRDLAESVAAELDHDLRTVVVDVTDDDADGPSAWLDALDEWSDTPCTRTPPASGVSVILFTSGTEGKPKAVMHTEQTLNSNVRAVWRSFELGDGEVVWMPSPVGHSSGFGYGIRIALLHGATLVLQDRWDAEVAVSLIQDERPTYTLAATIFLTDVLRVAQSRSTDLSSLRVFGCGGAPIPAEVVSAAAEQGINVLRLYGQSETQVATQNGASSPLQKRIDTDGRAVDGFKIEIRDENGAPLPPGTAGELCVMGPGMSVGYYKDPDRTLKKFRDGWAHTADVAVMDADGYVTIIGRQSDIIIRAGLNIAPREIEEEIEHLDSVETAVIVGLPHARLGEHCCVCVVPRCGAQPTLEQICSHLKTAGFAAYKLPERLELLAELPTTASGKIQRHKLVARFSKTTP